MGVSQVTGKSENYDSSVTKVKTNQTKTENKAEKKQTEDTAAVYEKSKKSDNSRKIYKRDADTIEKMLADAERRTQSLRNLVEKMLLKQGQTVTDATDIYALLREGKVDVDPETRAQAQKDIAADGYWGVEQTSERLVSFAKALTGGDPSKADEMIAAVKKGFEQATKAWGGDLPEICRNTLDTAISKLEAWRDSIKAENTMADTAEGAFNDQAATGKVAK